MQPKRQDNDRLETRRGTIRHRHRKMSKGIEMLRLDRELKPILDRWRAAMQQGARRS